MALLSVDHDPIEIRRALPGDPGDTQARYVEAAINGVIVASLYLPNGNPVPGPEVRLPSWSGSNACCPTPEA